MLKQTCFFWFIDHVSQSMFAYSIIDKKTIERKAHVPLVNTTLMQCCSFIENKCVLETASALKIKKLNQSEISL